MHPVDLLKYGSHFKLDLPSEDTLANRVLLGALDCKIEIHFLCSSIVQI